MVFKCSDLSLNKPRHLNNQSTTLMGVIPIKSFNSSNKDDAESDFGLQDDFNLFVDNPNHYRDSNKFDNDPESESIKE